MTTPMRALVIHNFYRSESPSGENLSVADEIAGLRERGWDVETLSSDSDAISAGAIRFADLAVRPIYSRRSVRRLELAVARFRPHVALVENVFPLHSPAVIGTLHKLGVPIAAGVRSYRMWCVGSTMFRDGRDCRECEGTRLNLPAVRHGCYQDRPVASVPMAVGLAAHRPTWRHVDHFLAVSENIRGELLRFGIGPERITVRPNYVNDPLGGDGPDGDGPGRAGEPGSGFFFAGRLTPDKGIDLLIDAWCRSEVWTDPKQRLFVAGSGPLDALVAALPERFGVERLGLISHAEALDRTARAAVTVVPSMWVEPFGRGVVEAAATGRPALVTRRGALADLVIDGHTGWVAEPTLDGLTTALRRAADTGDQRRYGAAARARYLTHYTKAVSIGILDQTLHRLAGCAT